MHKEWLFRQMFFQKGAWDMTRLDTCSLFLLVCRREGVVVLGGCFFFSPLPLNLAMTSWEATNGTDLFKTAFAALERRLQVHSCMWQTPVVPENTADRNGLTFQTRTISPACYAYTWHEKRSRIIHWTISCSPVGYSCSGHNWYK